MPRLTDILLTITYSMACCVGALALMRFFALPPVTTLAIAAVGVTLALQFHVTAFNDQFRKGLRAEMKAVRKRQDKLERQARLTAETMQALTEDYAVRGQAREKALVSEMKVLEGLIRRMGESMPEPETVIGAPPGSDIIQIVRDALEENRVDLYLQPVVSLPQRRVNYYEAFTRLRDESGRVIMPGEFLKAAADAGLMTAIDNLLLFRCVQLVRRLAQKERRIGVFCNLAPESLEDPDFFPQFLDFMRQNSDLAGSLIFEMGQEAFNRRTPEAARNMSRLADFGFRFSIDHASDLDADFADMRRAGVKFFKAGGSMLVERLLSGASRSVAEPADYAGHLARFGIELIAEKLETESMVVEILDLDASLGQGHLFGAPRPVRDDVLAAGEAPEPVPAADQPQRAAMH